MNHSLPVSMMLAVCGCSSAFTPADGSTGFDAGPAQPCTVPGSTEEVPCGECGTVERFCTAERIWSYGSCENDACVTEDCDMPGALESVRCGMCGARERFCTSERLWEYGPCEGDSDCTPDCVGECTPGTSRSSSCGLCGMQTDVCSAACVWETGTCEGDGECAPGTIEATAAGCPPGQMRVLECQPDCSYSVLSPCATPSPVTFDFPLTTDDGDSLSAWYDETYIAGTRMTSLSSATSMDISVTPTNTLLASGCSLSVLVFLNDVQVGTFNVPWESMATINRTYAFAAIAGPTYTVRYESTNGREGCGAVYFEETMPPGTVTLRP